ncbi:PepSY-associated TM helix domain-containing protein [Blastomonas fulva]|uniref:PepSY-associated TM helix domain-containing protein n=1 Tax=Blastomonas fulva TaxID=1550728 RepID=UPI003F6FA6B3
MSAVASDTPRTVHGDEAQAGRRKAVPLSYWLHSLVGLKLSLFLGFVCLTGTIATVAHEIEWLYKPAVRASAMQREADWGAMWDAAKAAHPYATLTAIGSYERNDAPYFAKSVSATDGTGQDFTIYVDPGTSRVTGHEYGRSFQDAMRALHYYLFAPGPIPMYIVTSLGFLLVLSLVTGLISYKKFWRGFWRMPRWHRDLRTVMGDLHRLIGLWSVWFVAVIGVTSIWYFVEHAGLDLNTPPPFVKPIQPATDITGDQISRWTRIARREMPGLAITAVHLPYGPGDPAIVQGQWQAWLVRERTNAVFIDPATDEMVGKRIAHEMGVGERIVHTADPLHFGTFGGLATKLIWVVFGVALVAMAGSGAVIYAKRLRIAAGSGVAMGMLDYLGDWKWPSILAITAVPGIAFWFW